MTKVQVQVRDRQTQLAAVPCDSDRGAAALCRLNPRDRQRILDRIHALERVADLVAELPYGRRWAA